MTRVVFLLGVPILLSLSPVLFAEPTPAVSVDELLAVDSQSVVDELLQSLAADDPAVRLDALARGSKVFRRDFQRAVLHRLQDPDAKVRKAALQLIVALQIEDGYAAVAEHFAAEFPGTLHESDVGESELELLYPYGPLVTTYAQLGAVAIPVLRTKLASRDVPTRLAAINLLGRTRRPEVVPDLAALVADQQPQIRQRAVRALGYIGTAAALDKLAALRDADDAAMLHEAAIGLSRHHDDRAIPFWERLLTLNNRRFFSYSALKWLSIYPPAQMVPIFLRGLADENDTVRRTSHEALQKFAHRDFGFRRALDASERETAIQHWNAWWRANKSREPHEILLSTLRSETGRHAEAAYMELILLGDRRAIPDLLKLPASATIGHSANEKVDLQWGLRILAAKSFDRPEDYLTWWNAHRDDKGAIRSPLVDPYRPLTLVATIDIGGSTEHLSVAGSLLFVGTRTHVEIYDLARVDRPDLVGQFRAFPRYQGVEDLLAKDGRIYLTLHDGGLQVYEYSAKGDLKHVSSHQEVRYGGHIHLHKDRLLVGSAAQAGAALYAAPHEGPLKLLHTLDRDSMRPCSLAGEGGFFTTADWSGDEIITKGRVPLATLQPRSWPTAGMTSDAKRFYCLDHGLLVVRDLATGKLLGRAPARARYDGKLIVRDQRVYALLEDMGIVVYNVSDPTNIEVICHTPLAEQSRRIYRGFALSGNHLFCADYNGTLSIFELPRE